jgi:hypothetical protein
MAGDRERTRVPGIYTLTPISPPSFLDALATKRGRLDTVSSKPRQANAIHLGVGL